MGFALAQPDDWLPGSVLLLGVEGARPHACGPAALQFSEAERPPAGGGVGGEEVAGLGHRRPVPASLWNLLFLLLAFVVLMTIIHYLRMIVKKKTVFLKKGSLLFFGIEILSFHRT